MSETHVYKLLTGLQWEAACAAGTTDVPIDREDGYIHFSTRAQVAETARLYFSDAPDVRLLRFSVDALPPLKWEASRGGQLFPHLYAPLEVARADAVWRLAKSADGAPLMPEDF